MSGEKTEQPSSKRLREAREKGDVSKSQDIPSAVTVMGLAVYVISSAESFFASLLTLVEVPMHYIARPYDESLPMVVGAMWSLALKIIGPIVALVMGLALVANLGQIGFLIALKGAMPKMENLSPSKWFKKTFAMKNVVEFIKNVLKVTVLSYVVYNVLQAHIRDLFCIQQGTIWDLWRITGATLGDMLFQGAAAFCVLAALDYLYQKYQYNKQHMMSKEEVKQEYKESEGDPQIKGKRKQLHQEMLNQNNLGNVRKAKVLVTNPTHFAIALEYEKDKTPLPIILAKGEGHLAERMIAVAKEEGIPIMQNVPLARSLFKDGTENSYIPKDLIAPVAEVLRWVQSLK